MTFPWGEYLGVAEALLQHRGTFAHEEACCRASMSRVYYAVFGTVRNYAMAREGLQLWGTARDHQDVQHHFEQGPRPEHRTIGYWLMVLRDARNQADYDETVPNVVRQAEEAVECARDAFGALRVLQGEPL